MIGATVRQTAALAGRSLRRTLRTPETLVGVTVQPTLFLLLFDLIFGGAVAGSTEKYLDYLVPGVLVQSVLLGCIDVGTNLQVDLSSGVFDRFRSLPISRMAPLLGAVLADTVRYLCAVVATVAVGYALGFRIHTSAWSAVAGGVLAIGFALCVCWISVLVGITARSAAAVQGVLLVALFPLTFASTVFVPLTSMPGWLQAAVRANPVSQLANAVRGLLVGGPVTRSLAWTVGWMVVLLVVFVPAALRAYRRRQS